MYENAITAFPCHSLFSEDIPHSYFTSVQSIHNHQLWTFMALSMACTLMLIIGNPTPFNMRFWMVNNQRKNWTEFYICQHWKLFGTTNNFHEFLPLIFVGICSVWNAILEGTFSHKGRRKFHMNFCSDPSLFLQKCIIQMSSVFPFRIILRKIQKKCLTKFPWNDHHYFFIRQFIPEISNNNNKKKLVRIVRYA